MVPKLVVLPERIVQRSKLHALDGGLLKQELSSVGVAPAVQTAILRQQGCHLEELMDVIKVVP